MYELKKFQKKYPLLTEFVSDKKKIKTLLEDKKLSEFYIKENNLLESFINNLKLIYNDEKVKNIVMDFINNKNYDKLKKVSYNLNEFITRYKFYDENLESIKEIDWLIIENEGFHFNEFELENIVLELCFINNYKEIIYVNNYDIKDIFMKTSSLVTKRKLYSLLKNNNLDFFAFIINILSKYNINIENIDDIFNKEIHDSIYNPEIRENLSEQDFLKLITYYFDSATPKEHKKINSLIEDKNYELISNILLKRGDYKFSRYIEEDEFEKDIFSLEKVDLYQISEIIYDRLSRKEKLNIEYLNKLSYSVGQKSYTEFYEKNRELLDLLMNLHYQNFVKLTKEEQKAIYKYIKDLKEDEKQLLVEEIKLINAELRTLYRNKFLEVFLNSNNIIEKAKEKEIIDTYEKKHNIRIYELKDEEPFTFLITVMHNQARDTFLNMYGRPAHKLTINNPSNFCKDLQGGSEIISTSMINDRFIDTFVGPYADVMYIFSDLESDDILSICHEDAAFPPKIEDNLDLFSNNAPVGPEELMRETINNRDYNEIAIKRKRDEKTRIMPTAILCYDEINDTSIRHAEYFNIPIIVINTKTYKALKDYTKPKEKDVITRKY